MHIFKKGKQIGENISMIIVYIRIEDSIFVYFVKTDYILIYLYHLVGEEEIS